MSWRIEAAEPLALLRELPDQWAQTCVTSPPDGDALTLAVLREVQRVLREDGTLWLLLLRRRGEPLLSALIDQGWIRQPLPPGATALTGAPSRSLRVFLLTKGHDYFYKGHLLARHPGPQKQACPRTGRQARIAQRCVHAPGHRRELVKRCVLAGSSMLACGACGAPYRQAQPGERTPGIRRATCQHHNPRGRCLVLDPFYQPGAGTAETAHYYGRSFLGITRAGESR